MSDGNAVLWYSDVCAKTACCKHLFQVFEIFQRYVASVSHDVAISRLGCCTCCYRYTHILQASVLNVSTVFSRRMLQVCLFECYI
jgi:hypothetical protein